MIVGPTLYLQNGTDSPKYAWSTWKETAYRNLCRILSQLILFSIDVKLDLLGPPRY